MAIEHVQDPTVSMQTTGGTINLTFGVAPTTGNLVVVMIGGYNNLGPQARYWGVSAGGRLDVDQPARFDRTCKPVGRAAPPRTPPASRR